MIGDTICRKADDTNSRWKKLRGLPVNDWMGLLPKKVETNSEH
jgi:hypothetical protein